MSYVLRDRGGLTPAFKSVIGVLTGDTASPVLWNIYFAQLGDWLRVLFIGRVLWWLDLLGSVWYRAGDCRVWYRGSLTLPLLDCTCL